MSFLCSPFKFLYVVPVSSSLVSYPDYHGHVELTIVIMSGENFAVNREDRHVISFIFCLRHLDWLQTFSLEAISVILIVNYF